MYKNEVVHINKSLRTKSISTPKILIKDQKHYTRTGYFPTRLVTPATTFSDTSEKVGYPVLKNIQENNDINYTRFKIVQESQVKKNGNN